MVDNTIPNWLLQGARKEGKEEQGVHPKHHFIWSKQCQNRVCQQQDKTSDKAKLWASEHQFNAEYDIPDMLWSEGTTFEQAWGGYRSMSKEITAHFLPASMPEELFLWTSHSLYLWIFTDKRMLVI